MEVFIFLNFHLSGNEWAGKIKNLFRNLVEHGHSWSVGWKAVICHSLVWHSHFCFLVELDHAPPKLEKQPCFTKIWKTTMLHQKNKNDCVPPKFQKRPCSTKIWEATMLHQKIKMTVVHQNMTNDLKFWWNMVIFIIGWNFFRKGRKMKVGNFNQNLLCLNLRKRGKVF